MAKIKPKLSKSKSSQWEIIDDVSTMGYRDDSPYRNRESIDIHSPNGLIDMSETGMPILANGRYLPPYSGMHQFEPGVVRKERVMQDGGQYLTVDGEYHRVYRNANGDIIVNHPKEDKGKWDTINLTDKSDANTIAEGVSSVKKWHKENPYAFGGNVMLERYKEGGKRKKKKQATTTEISKFDMYGKPIESKFTVDPNVERSYYDPRIDAIFMQKDYNELDPYQKERMLAHENYHAYQFKNDRSTYLPIKDVPYQRPSMVSTDDIYYGYHNRKPIEAQIDIDRFKKENPSFQFVSDDVVFNKVVDPEQYLNPETFEGEAKFYEDLGAESNEPLYAKGGLIKRADGSYSKRGLWDNIRENAGSGKKPTKEMLKQEKKIKASEKKANGGNLFEKIKDGEKITTEQEEKSLRKRKFFQDLISSNALEQTPTIEEVFQNHYKQPFNLTPKSQYPLPGQSVAIPPQFKKGGKVNTDWEILEEAKDGKKIKPKYEWSNQQTTTPSITVQGNNNVSRTEGNRKLTKQEIEKIGLNREIQNQLNKEREYNQRKQNIQQSIEAQGQPLSAENLKTQTQATGDKLSFAMNTPYGNPNQYPVASQYINALDEINPFKFIGDKASDLGAAPQDIKEGNYLKAAMSVVSPLAVGAMAGIGTQNIGQFANNIVNPLAGVENPFKHLNVYKHLPEDAIISKLGIGNNNPYLHNKSKFLLSDAESEVNDNLLKGFGINKKENSNLRVKLINGEDTDFKFKIYENGKHIGEVGLNKKFTVPESKRGLFYEKDEDFPYAHTNQEDYKGSGISGEVNKAITNMLQNNQLGTLKSSLNHTPEGLARWKKLKDIGAANNLENNRFELFKNGGLLESTTDSINTILNNNPETTYRGSIRDKYNNPINSKIKNTDESRSRYDSRFNEILLGEDYKNATPEQKERMLAHEGFHAKQFAEGKSRFITDRDIPYKRPSIVSTDEIYDNYHNRKQVESDIDVNNWTNQNPSFKFAPRQLVFNNIVDNQQYDNPYSLEGEATYYENSGEIPPTYQSGGSVNIMGETRSGNSLIPTEYSSSINRFKKTYKPNPIGGEPLLFLEKIQDKTYQLPKLQQQEISQNLPQEQSLETNPYTKGSYYTIKTGSSYRNPETQAFEPKTFLIDKTTGKRLTQPKFQSGGNVPIPGTPQQYQAYQDSLNAFNLTESFRKLPHGEKWWDSPNLRENQKLPIYDNEIRIVDKDSGDVTNTLHKGYKNNKPKKWEKLHNADSVSVEYPVYQKPTQPIGRQQEETYIMPKLDLESNNYSEFNTIPFEKDSYFTVDKNSGFPDRIEQMTDYYNKKTGKKLGTYPTKKKSGGKIESDWEIIEDFDEMSEYKNGGKTPAWQRKEGKSPTGGLNAKGRASLKAEGHDIKPPQPQGGARKKSFCSRMKGMKKKNTSAKTANDPNSRINLSLKKWKC